MRVITNAGKRVGDWDYFRSMAQSCWWLRRSWRARSILDSTDHRMVRVWSKKVALHPSRQTCEVSIDESDLYRGVRERDCLLRLRLSGRLFLGAPLF